MPILKLSTSQLNLSAVLLNGQSFRWVFENGSFFGTAHKRLWKIKRVDDTKIEYSVLASVPDCHDSHEDVLKQYFQTEIDLESLHDDWSNSDVHIKRLLESHQTLKGIRILDQEPLETLLAFICSANNNIKRISKMVNRLCSLYGTKMEALSLTDQDQMIVDANSDVLYAFPSVTQLQSGLSSMESQLRCDGFGYRASYIANTVKQLAVLGDDYLLSLRDQELKLAKENLRKFSGVGPKVADCICLMGLRKHHVVPVDTHVYKITMRDYRPSLSSKSLTPIVHEEIGQFYIEKFGDYAGWAQGLLFNAQLAQKRPTPTGGYTVEEKKKKKKENV